MALSDGSLDELFSRLSQDNIEVSPRLAVDKHKLGSAQTRDNAADGVLYT